MSEIRKVSQEKYEELVARLKYLETEARAEVAAAIKTAKEFGDLSENAEYIAAKDVQVQIETEIAKLADTLTYIEVIDEKSINTNEVSFGTKIKVKDKSSGEKMVFKLVSSLEASSREGKISDQSPIGKALVGGKKGDVVLAKTPGGMVELEILEITK